MARGHSTSAVDNRLMSEFNRVEPVAKFWHRAMKPIIAKMPPVEQVDGSGHVTSTRVKRLGVSSITNLGAGIDDGAAAVDGGNNVIG